MRGLVLLLVVAVAIVIAAPRTKHQTPEAKACHDLLDPFETRGTDKATVDKCILEQPGLKAILDGLKPAANATLARDHEGRHEGPIELLHTAGKTAELAKLNQCIATVNGHVIVAANGTASFDVTKFKGEVTAKVARTTSQKNTTLGLDSCPTKDLVAFNVHEFMECVEVFCATGKAPLTKVTG